MRSANALLRCCFPCSIRTTFPHANGRSSPCHPAPIRTRPLTVTSKDGRLCISSYPLPCLCEIRVEHRILCSISPPVDKRIPLALLLWWSCFSLSIEKEECCHYVNRSSGIIYQ